MRTRERECGGMGKRRKQLEIRRDERLEKHGNGRNVKIEKIKEDRPVI